MPPWSSLLENGLREGEAGRWEVITDRLQKLRWAVLLCESGAREKWLVIRNS